jgi:uncharacterized protein DUF5989
MSVEQSAAIRRPRSKYLQSLALRRQAAAIRQQTAYGLVIGWVLTLVAGFIFFCVPNRVDWLWSALIVVGLMHLGAAVVLPQSLAWPQRAWIALARWQGCLVMSVLLTVVYFALIWPANWLSRRGTRGFVAWDDQPPDSTTAWEPIDLPEMELSHAAGQHARSLPLLLAGVIGFFFRRGNYVLLAIVILLLVLGLVLYFVQSSALAPFIYTLF